tara:strand:+ start:58 stop:231 length:174 start_codon:yes stop_codon:yes gene_type:complete
MDLTTTNISYSKLEKEEFSNMLTKLQSVTKKNKSFIFKESLRHYYSRHFPQHQVSPW